ncbi:glycosyltransferase family 2 protein [Sphingobacterium arenae]|uniref:Glycosyltransferase family 2 protein n=1 Tax=Sphingobacterium arenae TaxID=1280598 RepID=A0ABR7XZI4_9SPHI|nr:glycosyltransferase family A protein [Sphingobacterium arenae]MBD1424441.1 glycosyltransferase family 2 protein [Sphingobacterium arenae]
MKNFRISFCTTCMNRLSYLKQTLAKNLDDNLDYENLEFVLLDYNSSDGLESYIKANYSEELKNGKLVYFKIDTIEFYDWTHSRNLVVSLATGDIICNIDADNFTGTGFATYVNHVFNQASDVFLTTYYVPLQKNDVLGRICMLKQSFLKIGGYDERMKHYGFEDIDLIHRLERSGLRKIDINNPVFLNALPHSNTERTSNSKEGAYLKDLYIKYITGYRSELLFHFQDGTTRQGTMINNILFSKLEPNIPSNFSLRYNYSILEDSWLGGFWRNGIPDNVNDFTNYYRVDSKYLREEALFFFHQISNRMIMEENTRKGTVTVKNEISKRGNLYKNFSPVPIDN